MDLLRLRSAPPPLTESSAAMASLPPPITLNHLRPSLIPPISPPPPATLEPPVLLLLTLLKQVKLRQPALTCSLPVFGGDGWWPPSLLLHSLLLQSCFAFLCLFSPTRSSKGKQSRYCDGWALEALTGAEVKHEQSRKVRDENSFLFSVWIKRWSHLMNWPICKD